jgi:hypothetical protein
LAGYQTTWAKRLAFGRPRETWRLLAKHTGARSDRQKPGC